MTKKYNPHYTKTSNSYVHPSLQSSRPSSSAPAPPQSVTERIQQLRREQAPRLSAERRNEITDVVTQRTVPPALRRLLNIPEVDPPRQKPGTRPRHLRATRPPPGPAPPTSWLYTGGHEPDPLRRARARNVRTEGSYWSPKFCALAMLEEDGEINRLPSGRSLVHYTLKAFTSNWDNMVEYEQHYLGALPASLKESLLTYLTRYGSKGCLDTRSFRILFLDEKDIHGGTGSDEIRFLDLTGLLNERFMLHDLYRYMTRQKPGTPDVLGDPSIENYGGKTAATTEVAESWEDEADTITTSIPKSITVSHFPQLTRLSLAHPGSFASWPQLLDLSTKLHTLTHLSLAYWPTPTSTPNAATVSMVSRHTSPIALSGTTIYSQLDDDWHEASNILRRLSLNTYNLKWLDLEGCTWMPALTFGLTEQARIARMTVSDEWVKLPENIGPDWTTTWSQITYLNLSQGWIPQDAASIQRIPAGVLGVQLLGWLREQQRLKKLPPKKPNVQPSDVEEWMEREKVAMSVGERIQKAKKAANKPYCRVDHGWDQRFGAL